MILRVEQSTDVDAIHRVVESAFGRSDEAELVASLRKGGKSVLSMVAMDGTETTTVTAGNRVQTVVGHVMFSEAILVNNPLGTKIVGLAPLSIVPEFQRQGVGSLLTRTGLEWCKAAGFGAVIVLGHPKYYPRFGFVPASQFGIHSEYCGIRDEAFMALELVHGALDACAGLVRYQPEFNQL